MINTTEATRYTLAQRELLALEHTDGLVVECIDGELWITIEGGAGDIILKAGKTLELPSHSRVFISALQNAQLAARPCRGNAPIREIASRCAAVFLARIERWRHLPLAGYPVARLR